MEEKGAGEQRHKRWGWIMRLSAVETRSSDCGSAGTREVPSAFISFKHALNKTGLSSEAREISARFTDVSVRKEARRGAYRRARATLASPLLAIRACGGGIWSEDVRFLGSIRNRGKSAVNCGKLSRAVDPSNNLPAGRCSVLLRDRKRLSRRSLVVSRSTLTKRIAFRADPELRISAR